MSKNIKPKFREPSEEWKAYKLTQEKKEEVASVVALQGTYENDKWYIHESSINPLRITPRHIEQNFENVIETLNQKI